MTFLWGKYSRHRAASAQQFHSPQMNAALSSRKSRAAGQGASLVATQAATSFQRALSQATQTSVSAAATLSAATPAKTASSAATPTPPASSAATPPQTEVVPSETTSQGGRIVFPIFMPAMPDLPSAPPVRLNPTATQVLDPATGTNAPPGYDSWAQLDQDVAIIAARNRAMHGYFQKIHAVIAEVQGRIESMQSPGQSQTQAKT